jgi:cellulose synthase/poly-beta-1,6-N-acetylglucosamine synthase-like glycosyltransferase
VNASPIEPSVSVLLAVRNEAANLPAKLANLRELEYPAEKIEVVVVSDGSTDETEEILSAHAGERLRYFALAEHQGKAVALTRAMAEARADIVVFMDARQRVEPGALRRLVANFADPSVGCVSGELMIGDGRESTSGAGLYWRMEKRIRQWESATGSVVQASGAFYAVRRDLAVPVPAGTILDDVYQPMNVVRQGKRVVFEPEARAWDPWETDSRQEFRRKVRTLTGNYQLLQLAPWLLTSVNPIRFEFVSHKLLRLFVPFALAALLVSSVLIEGSFYRGFAIAQAAFYGVSLLALPHVRLGVVGRLANVAWTFLVLNAAAVVALVYFLGRRKEVWAR